MDGINGITALYSIVTPIFVDSELDTYINEVYKRSLYRTKAFWFLIPAKMKAYLC